MALVPKFSVYLEQEAAERVAEGHAGGLPDGTERRDVFEASAAVREALRARGEAPAAPEVSAVEVTRVRMETPAGRFLDLLV